MDLLDCYIFEWNVPALCSTACLSGMDSGCAVPCRMKPETDAAETKQERGRKIMEEMGCSKRISIVNDVKALSSFDLKKRQSYSMWRAKKSEMPYCVGWSWFLSEWSCLGSMNHNSLMLDVQGADWQFMSWFIVPKGVKESIKYDNEMTLPWPCPVLGMTRSCSGCSP